MWLLTLLACSGSDADPTGDGTTPVTETDTPTTETGTTSTTTPTATTGATGATGTTAETGAELDCTALPPTPLTVTRLTGPPPGEDFAFDDQGHLISLGGSFLVKSTYPPSTVTPWVPADGSTASIRMLSTGDLVYHDLNTSSLFRVDPTGATTLVYSGFGYAGGIEVHPTDLVYVIDLVGLHLIEPYAKTHQRILQNAPWSFANGVSLSADYTTLYVSSNDGMWSMPVDAAGTPTAPPTLWAPPPPGARELLGMGVDACGNLYVTGSTLSESAVWRYPAAGGAPEVLVERVGGWLSNLQWGSGVGGWDTHVLYAVDRSFTNPGYDAIEVGVPAKPR